MLFEQPGTGAAADGRALAPGQNAGGCARGRAARPRARRAVGAAGAVRGARAHAALRPAGRVGPRLQHGGRTHPRQVTTRGRRPSHPETTLNGKGEGGYPKVSSRLIRYQ